MKKQFLFLLACMIVSMTALAQTATKTDTIKVYGNCNECKEKIEGSLKKKDGIVSKDWNKDTKMLTVTYNPAKITIQQIAQKIANVGYDSEYATAPDAVYNKLDK
ncbi:MAG TPA: heavy metal-associated domain-containing protein [Bacteroidia bacterium]|nr:heavy metal-associated domain-containing protein [Bacteroidia bacterium]